MELFLPRFDSRGTLAQVRLVHEAHLMLREFLDHLLRREQMQIEFEEWEKRGSFFAQRDGASG
jgi:hypothetical protein